MEKVLSKRSRRRLRLRVAKCMAEEDERATKRRADASRRMTLESGVEHGLLPACDEQPTSSAGIAGSCVESGGAHESDTEHSVDEDPALNQALPLVRVM